jgi:hypothetical protein
MQKDALVLVLKHSVLERILSPRGRGCNFPLRDSMPTEGRRAAMRPEGGGHWVSVFGRLAEACENVEKGARLLVDGKLDISESTDKEGQKRISFRTLADTCRLL